MDSYITWAVVAVLRVQAVAVAALAVQMLCAAMLQTLARMLLWAALDWLEVAAVRVRQ
jgi:hypothetical protein